MDRRDHPETAGSLSDEQLQKAFEVISLSYKGEDPDRLFREAIKCFDSLIEISLGNEMVREAAHRRSIDVKYLVDGASFVISRMHFNPENNFYITLGLPQSATPEELSRRWKKLMLLYHPDKQDGNEEWVEERAKKVNEAYTELKDEAKRSEYDRKLNEALLNSRFPSSSSHADPRHRRPRRSFSSHRTSSGPSPALGSLRQYMPRILFVLYALFAATVFGYIYMQNTSSHLDAELAPAVQKESVDQKTQDNKEVQKAPDVQDNKEVQKVQEIQKEKPVQSAAARETSAMQTVRSWFSVKTGKDKVQNVQRVQDGQTHKEVQKVQEAQDGQTHQEVQKVQEVQDGQAHKEAQKVQAALADRPVQPVRPILQASPVQQSHPKPEAITREEVEEFMQRYIRAYTKSDLNSFMSFFSPAVVENNSMNYSQIRNAYRETFSEKINYYKINNMEIRTDGQTATVSGIYNINRYISQDDRWVRYSGKIAWKLVRENGQLRIISVNYDK